MQDLYQVIRIRENEELQSVKKRLSLTLREETVKKGQGWTVLVVTLSVPHGLIFFPSSRRNARCFIKKLPCRQATPVWPWENLQQWAWSLSVCSLVSSP